MSARKSQLVTEIETAAEREPEPTIRPINAVFSTGSTELNLALSDTSNNAFPAGVMINIVGDSHAGKSFLAHSIQAEAAIRPEFANHEFYYDNAESSDTSGIVRMFGSSLVSRLKTPSPPTDTDNGCSHTIQDFKVNIWRLLREGKPFIYVLDSLDSLTSKEAEKQLDDAADGKTEKGTYGMEKSKVMSGILGPVCRKLEETNSLLIILSQTRDNISPMAFAEKTRSGGRALKFYAWTEMWLAQVKTIKKTVGGFERIIGHITRIKVTKNKLTAKVREAELYFYVDYGIDDIGRIIDFLVEGKFWPLSGRTINASNLNITGTKETLIDVIERDNLEDKLKEIMGGAWKVIEDGLRLGRKGKYA